MAAIHAVILFAMMLRAVMLCAATSREPTARGITPQFAVNLECGPILVLGMSPVPVSRKAMAAGAGSAIGSLVAQMGGRMGPRMGLTRRVLARFRYVVVLEISLPVPAGPPKVMAGGGLANPQTMDAAASEAKARARALARA